MKKKKDKTNLTKAIIFPIAIFLIGLLAVFNFITFNSLIAFVLGTVFGGWTFEE